MPDIPDTSASLAPLLLVDQAYAAMVHGAHYLHDLFDRGSETQPGRFIYSSQYPSGHINKGYNLLRHSGTTWSMLLVARELLNHPDYNDFAHVLINDADSALRWIATCFYPMPSWKLNQPLHSYGVSTKERIKTGGNGLTLLALAERLALPADTALRDQLVTYCLGLADGLMIQRRPNGDFWHKIHNDGTPVEEFESDYYTGEIIFGLLHWAFTFSKELSDQTLSPALFEIAQTHTAHLVTEVFSLLEELAQRSYKVTVQPHWMMYAVSYAITRFPDHSSNILRNYLLDIVTHVCEHSEIYFSRDESTPTACRSEGLLAAYPAFHHLPATQEKILQRVQLNIEKQLTYCKEDGAIVRGGHSNEVRIDYIQHNITSFLAYWKIQNTL